MGILMEGLFLARSETVSTVQGEMGMGIGSRSLLGPRRKERYQGSTECT